MNSKIAEQIVSYRLQNDVNIEASKNIGYLIKKERLKRDLRLTDVAKGICSLSYLSKIENNAIEPNDYIVEEICKRLGITPIVDNQKGDSKTNLLTLLVNDIERKTDDNIKHHINVLKTSFKNDDDHLTRLIHLTYSIYMSDLSKSKSLCQDLFKIHNHFSNYELCIFYEQLGSYHLLRKDYEDALRFLTLSYKLMKRLGLNRPLLIYKLAWVHYVGNRKYKSYLYARSASQLFSEQNSFFRKIQTEILISLCLAQEDYTLSLEKYNNLIQTTDHLNFHQLNYICRFNLGLLYIEYQEYTEALTVYKTLYKKADKNDLDALLKIIYIYLKIEDHNSVRHYLEKLDSIDTNLEKKFIYEHYFKIILNDYNGINLLKFYRNHALPYARKEKNVDLEIIFLQQRASLYEREGRYKDALEDYKKITKKAGVLK
ncbi:helix-turn-helix domain-containing protein [Haloplasma contractile]|uniref:Transcriptional regulator Cro-CI family protein n=1 Tax=Haloplasma contractile SSD-17B TaxID=1033810 RepID=U2FLA1_9MOLU|nr:helix-turn-helix transcriptional regulator [Haloplasma contractile]ERJ13515.1 Transcriptional regulator Cro-CI family protein [Haloplasma contractile SSD-17B]